MTEPLDFHRMVHTDLNVPKAVLAQRLSLLIEKGCSALRLRTAATLPTSRCRWRVVVAFDIILGRASG